MGSDMLLSFEKWYKYDEILKLAALLCVSRDSEDTDEILYSHARKITVECGGEIIIVKTCPFEVSSTQIRQMISFSEDCTCYLDENVVKYIYDKGLYKNSK
jgi:nicotinate-nucleotide adenylyltransferase